jgi:acetyltransferase-like isoleucine patch superfamily enzyme
MENIQANQIELGQGVFIHPTAIIRGIDGPADRIRIGDQVYIGAGVQIICNDFQIGDYGKIHHQVTIHGYQSCSIGHNAWIGQFSIIDCIGGATIGDNCGIGAHSQLWSHIKFGDTLEGCQFNSQKPLNIGKDVWFVGHCIVGPIQAADKSMALAGSVITHDMAYNQIYAGSPAKSISSKLGNQFVEVSTKEKMEKMRQYLSESGVDQEKIILVNHEDEINWESSDKSYFVISQRKYTKRQSMEEVRFMKYLLPEKAKFTPF